MAYRLFWILIEGNDDERFFELIIKPRFEEKHGAGAVGLWKYAQEPPKRVCNFLSAIKGMGADYILVTDIDFEPCVTAKKQKKQNRYANIDSAKILVVKKEIESWYLAGLNAATCKKLGVPAYSLTDSITKEEFCSIIPRKFRSPRDFMVEILKNFSIEIAKQKNTSFGYFVQKHDC